jgi:membrane protease YdiL (CAAX protease family)
VAPSSGNCCRASVLVGALGFALGRFLNIDAEQAARIRSLFPSSLLDKTVWVVLSITAGFCEEFVYRGYLQQQFRAMTGSLSAVVLQASAFGAAHLAFPWQIALMTVLLGLLVGTVAGWRRSLAPGMLFHAAFDILSGVLS